jgi:hypothetical protein
MTAHFAVDQTFHHTNVAAVQPVLRLPSRLLVSLLLSAAAFARGGTWTDHFASSVLASDWEGARDFFDISDGVLEGHSALPIAPSPLNLVEVGQDWTNYSIRCWINIVEPNTRVCTKGALILRHAGGEGYVFALHEATQTVEVYRLSNHEMLLSKPAVIELKKWYQVRAELQGDQMSFFVEDQLIGTILDTRTSSGAVGVAVQDAERVWFDDFTVTGPNIPGNIDDLEPPTIASIQRDGEKLVLRFVASPPYKYTVQFSSSLTGHDWQTLADFTAKLSSFEAVATDSLTNSLRFYRIEKSPCYCR